MNKWIAGLVISGLLAGITAAREAEPGIAERLMKSVPEEFPRIEFSGFPEESMLLSHYLWYHFHHRGGNGLTLFNKEYLLTSDIWMGNAVPRGGDQTIQEIDRNLLLGMQIDEEGYVQTHQHFSHAHDEGWPFPMWTQSDIDPDHIKGKTAGWHFQPLEQVPGWVGDALRRWQATEYCSAEAAANWELLHLKSIGIKNNRWQLEATGPSPALQTPAGYPINAFDAPYLQLRWKRSSRIETDYVPYIEWKRENDADFGVDRRVYFYPEKTPLSGDFWHSIVTMYRHPKWKGEIQRLRIALDPGGADGRFEIDSFFTVYDTRHTINNPIFILASARYFNWTGDRAFLRRNINRMRRALRYQQTVLGGLKFHHIRNPWPGHDGLPGFVRDAQGEITIHSGHGIGNNYWDLMPFGWDDLYATSQYYAATLAMADIEAAILQNPGWNMPAGALQLDPEPLRRHARKVKETANQKFWNDDTGRFVACIDKNGNAHDFGYTFLNLDAIWYGLANKKHARRIMEWISGERLVEGDTSTGQDIYHWRFGPRASTLRNVSWYGQGWYHPENIAWGGQVQDGGAVLGFSFYDLWARLHLLGADNAWQRLQEILDWEKDVQQAGGYRQYYKDGRHGNTLQGCGTPGGLGIDCEFYESSLVPSIVVYGFLGITAEPHGALAIHPNLPKACPQINIQNLRYHRVCMDLQVQNHNIQIKLKSDPLSPLNIHLATQWKSKAAPRLQNVFILPSAGEYSFIMKK